MLNTQLYYAISDIECLEDYFSLQLKSESCKTVTTIECFNDSDIIRLYNSLMKGTRPLYFYSINYDKTMLNALCKLVEKKQDNLLNKLRKINDYLIQENLDYFSLNREFWVDHFFTYQENDPDANFDELWERSHLAFLGRETEYNFIRDFPQVLGKSPVFKEKIINEIPKILRYFNIDVKKRIKPSISLKNLQLIKSGYSIKFDFNKYKSIAEIKKAELYEDFVKYGKNDVMALEDIFNESPKDQILQRLYAIEAVKMIKPDIDVSFVSIYSENNTNLINEILKLPEHRINKDIEIDYMKHINTNYPEFNNFVSHCNDMQHIKNDYEIKKSYTDIYQKTFIQDDYNILDGENKAGIQVNSVDEINIKSVYSNITDIIMKFGFGGAHGAIPNTILEKLIHYDFASQYPSIILQYKEYFKHIINIDLYEAIYNLKFELSEKVSLLTAENDKMYSLINDNGNDGADIAEYGSQIEENEKQIEYLKKIIKGVKLILNYSYGLINSNYKIPIACKKLGRFICFKGQELIINLCDKLKENNKITNINTDGVICTKNPIKMIEIGKDGYFVVDVKTIDKLIQNDVNNYLAVQGNYLKRKGMFNIGIKQKLAKNEKIYINTENAINLILNKDIEIKPIYFGSKYFDTNLHSKLWYFTTKDKGNIVIKRLKKPEILSINGEEFYFTDDKSKSDYKMYLKYAKMTKEKILNFKMNIKESNNPYFERILIKDNSELIKEKRQIKRRFNKLLGNKQIGFTGYMGNSKANSYINNEPITPLIQYTMSQILESTDCNGFSIENNKHNSKLPFLIIDVDIYDKKTGKAKKGWGIVSEFLKKLKACNTFECWNKKTEKYNRKFVFLNNSTFKDAFNSKAFKPWHNYIELLDKATIYTLSGYDLKYDCNWVEPKEVPPNLLV